MTTDVKLNSSEGYYDIGWTENGDIDTRESLDTAILMSIFNEVRAAASEMPESFRRRGWIGNDSTVGFEQGSKQWLFHQERITGSVLADLAVVISNGLQWLVEDNIAVSARVPRVQLSGQAILAHVELGRSGSEVDKKIYELWNNTAREGF